MFTVKTLDGGICQIGFRLLCCMAMKADWQIRNMGYDPPSITSAFLTLENRLQNPVVKSLTSD